MKLNEFIDPAASADVLMTKREVAAYFKVTLRTVNAWMTRQLIPYCKIGRTVRFRRKDIESNHVQIDETPIRYLAPGNGQTKLGYLWTAHRPRGDVVYRWETSRAAAFGKCPVGGLH